MKMLAPSHYESMFSSAALMHRRSHMCRLECNVRRCAEELLGSSVTYVCVHKNSFRTILRFISR